MSWRRILLLSLALVVVLAGGTWLLVDRSALATDLVRRELAALLRPACRVAATTIELGSARVALQDLRVADPLQPDRDLLHVERAAVDAGLCFGAPWLSIAGVEVDGFAIEVGPSWPTLTDLLVSSPSPGSAGPARLPAVELRRGRVLVHLRSDEPPLRLEDLELAARPLPDGTGLQLRGSARWPERQASLQLEGTWYLDGHGEASVRLEPLDPAAGIASDTAAAARFARLFHADIDALELAGTLRRLTLVARIPTKGSAPELEAEAELAHTRLSGSLDGFRIPAILRDASLRLTAATRDEGTAALHLTQTTEAGNLDLSVRGTALFGEPHLDVRLHGTGVAIDGGVLEALDTFEVGREIRRALSPTTGRADIDLFLRDPHVRGGVTELDLDLRDVAMSYHGFGPAASRAAFPLPMHHARGRVRLRGDLLRLEDVHANIDAAAGGDVTLQGHVALDRPGGEDTTLDIKATGVGFCVELRQALAALLRDDGALYDRFDATGTADVAVTVRPMSQLPGGWAVEVRPQAASMRWAGFPYRLDELGGTVRAAHDDVRFELHGRHGDGRMAMAGHLPIGDDVDRSGGFAARIELQSVAVDEDLRQAVAVIAPELDEPWRRAEPSGRFSAEVTVRRPTGDAPLVHDAALDLQGVDLRLPVAPWRALGLHGRAVVQGSGSDTRLDFDALRGRLRHDDPDEAQLAMLGHLVFGTAAQKDLTFVVRDLDLDRQLGSSLEELEALGAGTWQSLAPSGRVDLVCRYRDTPERPDDLELVVHLIDVGSDASLLPHRAEHMTGELAVADGELTFTDVRAELAGAKFRGTRGRVRNLPAPDGRTEIAFTVSADDVPIDEQFANLFADPLHTAIQKRRPVGRADIGDLQLRFLQPQPGNPLPLETSIQGEMRLHGLDLTLGDGPEGIRVRDIHGTVVLAPSRVSSAGGALTGALRSVSLQLFDHPFEAVKADFSADAERLVMPTLSARWHGGTLDTGSAEHPALQYELPGPSVPEGRLSADLQYRSVDVYSFLDTCGWTNPPYSGKASGRARIERLDGYDVVSARGSGDMAIRDADLGVVPLFTAIYAQLPAADRPRFQAMDLAFAMQDRTVRFDRLDVRSDVVGAKGKGTLDLDGYLEVELTLDNLLGSSADPLLMPLIDYLAQNIVTFYLHGYLRDLRAEKRWITESAPRRRVAVPLPPAPVRGTAPPF